MSLPSVASSALALVVVIAAGCASTSSASPTVDDRPAIPAAETGFIDVPPQRENGDPAPARLFYAFRAADEAPEQKPIFLLFNGGPGASTTSALLVWGTGPSRIVMLPDGSSSVQPNAASLTRFGNVLWVDERMTGFSYDLGGADKPCSFDVVADAEDYIRVLLGFVAKHPRLRDAKVGIIGESYGGVRATSIVHQMRHAGEAGGTRPEVATLVEEWLGAPPTPDAVTARFVGVALIQPLLLGRPQLEAQSAAAEALRAAHPPRPDPYDVRNQMTRPDPSGAFPPSVELAAIADPDGARALFGVDLAATPRLAPADRATAARVGDPTVVRSRSVLDEALTARLGELRSGDRYYDEIAMRCSSASLKDLPIDRAWSDDLLRSGIPLLVTDARYDIAIRSSFIFDVLAASGYRVSDAKPGWRILTTPKDAKEVAVRFPSYESGHMVTKTDGEKFADDFGVWLASGGRP